MVIAKYQMARWHDGTKGGRLGKIMLEYCNLPRRIVESMGLQYSCCQCARPGRFDSRIGMLIRILTFQII